MPAPEPAAARGTLRLALGWIRLLSFVVPSAERRRWRREWRAELCYLDRRSTLGRRVATLAAAAQALPHAAWLAAQEWSLDVMMQDLRHAWRALTRAPRTTAATLLALCVGIAAASAVFSFVDGLLLRPFPYPRADRLLSVHTASAQHGFGHGQMSAPDYFDLREQSDTLATMTLYAPRDMDLAGGEVAPRRLRGAYVTATLLETLGVPPLLGRGFLAAEDTRDGPRVAMLSERLWRRDFAADPAVLGQTVTVNGTAREVVGVLATEHAFPDDAELWLPMGIGRDDFPRYNRSFSVLARLADGFEEAQARGELQALGERLAAAHPETNGGFGLSARSLRQGRSARLRTASLLLAGAVGFLLLIVCANVANLLLARGLGRRAEMAMRVTLGAGRLRILRQVLAESALLAVAGTAAGLTLGSAAAQTLYRSLPFALPPWLEVRADAHLLAFAAATAFATALLFGLLPALHAARPDLVSALRGGSRRTTLGPAGRRLRAGLAIVQVALSLTLVVGAGLLVKSFSRLLRVDPGFATGSTLTLATQLPRARYQGADRTAFAERLLSEVRALPGVRRAGAASGLTFLDLSRTRMLAEGQDLEAWNSNPHVVFSSALPGFFAAFGLPLERGRDFQPSDDAEAPAVAIVNTTAARRFFGGLDIVGRRLKLGHPDDDPPWVEVVGVVGDVLAEGLDQPPEPVLYLPFAQETWSTVRLVIQSDLAAAPTVAAVRRVLDELDAGLVLYDVQTLGRLVEGSLWRQRLLSVQMWTFAAIATVMAMLGIAGVVLYLVSERRREMGIRLALGARPGEVVRLVVRQGLILVAAGLALGTAGALLLGRALSSQLFETAPADPATLLAALLFLAATGLAASYLPARRASRVDPAATLRAE